MKKNGFTLVELLAIIIIIGMLVTITAPYIINSINTSKKHAFKNSVEGIVRAIKEEAAEINYTEMEYTITDGTITDSEGKELKTAGGDGETGSAYIDENGRVAIAVQNRDKKMCAQKTLNQSHLTITENKTNCIRNN